MAGDATERQEVSGPSATKKLGPPKRGQFGLPEAGGTVVRGSGGVKPGPGLVATRSFAYGEPILREPPLLLVPKDAKAFLQTAGAEPMLAAAERLGDASRLAVFLAFSRLEGPQREELLSMGVGESCTVERDTRRIVSMFLKDFPQFAGILDWNLFCRVVAVVSDRGSQLPGGERAVHRLSSLAAHSCAPNAVIETLGDSGIKELRAIAYEGISENEAITVSYVDEEALLLPLEKRREALRRARGLAACACPRCAAGEDGEGALPLVEGLLKASKSSSEATIRCQVCDLERLDAMLPFALVGKARVRAKLGQACEARESEALLPEAESLYEACIEETHIVLGQKGLRNADNVRKRLEVVRGRME